MVRRNRRKAVRDTSNQSSRKRAHSPRPSVEFLEDRTLPSTFSVLNTADSGAGSLRQAILDANANPGADLIRFNIGGSGVQSISPLSALPTITSPVTLDATTQPGYAGTPLIELNGASAGTSSGLVISAGSSTVRGLVINRFNQFGLLLQANGGNLVEGNYVGTDATGAVARGNGRDGVYVGSPNSRIIGNLISGNLAVGLILGSSGSVAEGNRIGVNAAGVQALGNGNHGVWIAAAATNDVLGGTAPAARNVISGNAWSGVYIEGSGHQVQGNYIGTDVTGTLALGNDVGLSLYAGDNNTVGGTTAGAGNLISGNVRYGVSITHNATGNRFQGNYIGTDLTGTLAVPNRSGGVQFHSIGEGPSLNVIGGTETGAGNVISGNQVSGIILKGPLTVSNRVEGNWIGTRVGGVGALANTGFGVFLQEGTRQNIIGGTTIGAGNVIAHNSNRGIAVESSTAGGNRLSGNSIHSNAGLGIDLLGGNEPGGSGVTANDAADADMGPNGLQNYPVLSYTFSTGGQTTVSGLLDSTPNTTFTLEFFSNTVTDDSGFGEGQTYLGSAQVTTDAAGRASFTAVVGGTPLGDRFVVGTATDPNGSTSEFSAALVLAAGEVIGTVQMPFAGTLSAAVYNANGQIVRTLFEGTPQPAGPVDLRWDGTDDFGIPMPAGQYHWRTVISQVQAVDDGQVGELANVPYGPGEHSQSVTSVAADAAGNVYESSYWEESHKELRKWDASGSAIWSVSFVGGGGALAVDDSYVYATRETGGQNRVERLRAADGTPAPWTGTSQGYLVINPTEARGVFGLAVDAARLWVSNFAQNRIEVYDKATGAFLGQFAVTGPRRLAADGGGNVWAAHGSDRVGKFSAAGTVLASITGLNGPYAVALGGPANRLFIGEIGSSKVREYDPATLTQVRELFGAAQPGPVSPYAFYWKTLQQAGLAVDPLGRMIVADPGNHRVLTFYPDGTLLRTRYSEFQPAPFTDPSVDPNMLLSTWIEYQVDYTPGPTYGQWTVAANWLPADGQLYSAQSLIRRLPNGQEYLYYFGVEGGVAVYQLGGPNGMRRSAILGGNQALWNWTDSDGDGQVEPSETAQRDPNIGQPYYQSLSPGWWVDHAGNAYIASWLNYVPGIGNLGSTVKVPLLGFDALGNPLYDWASRQTVAAADAGFWQFQPTNLRVDPSNSNLYRIGTTVRNRDFGPFWMGGTAVERLAPDGTRLNLMPISPVTEAPNLSAIATDTDGNYFYTGHSGGDQLWVRMYTSDGMLVATGRVGPNNGGSSGWIDHGLGLAAFTHPASGTHYVYAEDVYWGKSIRFRIDQLNTLQRVNGTFAWTSDPYLVTNTNDSGPGSLRQAIVNANGRDGLDVIRFNIPGAGVHTISPLSPLPAITDAVTIDGTSEPDYTSTPVIELSGALAVSATVGGTVNGLVLSASNSTIQGLVINRFSGMGLLITTGANNLIQSNYVGTDATGTVARGNGRDGVYVGSLNTRVIGNLISGNLGAGLVVGSGAVVQGNLIGTDVTGTRALGNASAGVWVGFDATGSLIGGATPAVRNVISGNAWNGVYIEGSNHLVQGNFIGTDITGTLALGNDVGLVVFTGDNNTIGGTTAAVRNLISGNARYGLSITHNATGNRIQGNYIGTDMTGALAVPNRSGGVEITSSAAGPSQNILGGMEAGAGNVISGNLGAGVTLRGSLTVGNRVEGNWIGTRAGGVGALANTGEGVILLNGPQQNVIGGATGAAGNTVAFNGKHGILVLSSTTSGNRISGNSIHNNAWLGIDLQGGDESGGNGVTANDAADADVGPNGLQNYPVLSSAHAGSSTRVLGTLSSTPNSTFILEFYASTAADSSGFGEGQRYLGSTVVATNAGGTASFDVTLAGASIANEFVTATATDAAGSTSEFSAVCLLPPNSAPTASSGGPYTVGEGGSIILVGGGNDPDGDALSYAWDLDNNGTFETSGPNPTFSTAGRDGPFTQSVVLKVNDPSGAYALASTTVTITNGVPVASITASTAGVRGQTQTFTLSASDPSTADQAAGFEYTLTWGDGSLPRVISRMGGNGSGTVADHVYTAAGTYIVTVTATDKDNGTSALTSCIVTITATAVQPDPSINGATQLVIGGTPGNDNIVINGGGGDARVSINGVSLGTFSFTGRIVVYAQAGDDDVQTAGSITRPVWAYGGDGHDRLKGGGGHDLLFGGVGDDLLVGGDGRDLLVGGLGADRIVGNPDDDILIAGTTAFDSNETALDAIMAEWTSSRDTGTRMANLGGTGSGTRANGNHVLIATGIDRTVFDDGACDVLTGSSGTDWFFANLSGPGLLDRITDLSASEFANDLEFISSVI